MFNKYIYIYVPNMYMYVYITYKIYPLRELISIDRELEWAGTEKQQQSDV